MSFISIAIFIISISFALLAIYIAKMLLRVSGLFQTLGKTFADIEKKLDQSIHKVGELLNQSEKTTMDVEEKLKATEGLFLSLKNVGDATQIMSNNMREHSSRYKRRGTLVGTKNFVQAIQYGEYASVLFKSWQQGKNASL